MKFNLCLESVIRTEPQMRVMKLKQFWDPKNPELVLNDKITEVGMTAYWYALDTTFRYNEKRRDIYLAKQLCQKDQKEREAMEKPKRDDLCQPDDMNQFFKCHRHVECRRDTCEDLSSGRHVESRMVSREDTAFNNWNRSGGRFLLPRLQQRF